MSIPTHNLYEFVHQVLKREAMLYVFKDWGNKNLTNLQYIGKKSFVELEPIYKISNSNFIYFQKKLPDKWHRYLPKVICHDQEPLNFDLYSDDNVFNNCLPEIVDKNFYSSFQYDTEDYSSIVKDLNLRYVRPSDWTKKWILLHSELNSNEVEKYNNTNKFLCTYWWSNAIIARDWYRFAEHDYNLDKPLQLDKMFLIYCRDATGSRKYRSDFLKMINAKNILDHCQLVSYNEEDCIDANSSAEYHANDFVKTGISVVLETVFDQRIHLTEKTLRPIACGHPFIIANGPGTLEYLKKYGFKTFSPYINESYDKELDNNKRLKMIADEIDRITMIPREKQIMMLAAIKEITEHNKKIFFSKQFSDQVCEELSDNLSEAIAKVKYKMEWKYRWDMHMETKRTNPNHQIFKNKKERALLITLLRHLKKGGTLENYVPPNSD